MTNKINQRVEELALKHTNLNVLRDSEYYPLTLEDLEQALHQTRQEAFEEALELVGEDKPLIKSIAYTKENEEAKTYNQAKAELREALTAKINNL